MRKDIYAFCPPVCDVIIDTDEALRYMGVRGGAADDILINEVNEVKRLLEKAVHYRACYILTDISTVSEDETVIGDISVRSHSLARNLEGCSHAYLFAATVGADVDRLIARLSVTSSARGLMADALGSAAIEGLCDLLNRRLSEGIVTRPRYSPGYGDMGLKYQSEIISLLEADRTAGITLTQSLMLTPTKSVTALIGIKTEGK